ncbi:hypothetical protein KMT30_09615 [Streptomyces sp. IBSBF 2953]|nr:hypothetical protein [Streptomyces hayashii]
MNRAADALTMHQLLGRIVYFHALFIEPALGPSPPSGPSSACCNHTAAPGRRAIADLLPDSAWTALVEVATTLPEHFRPCPHATGACCATCCIASAAEAVAAGWAQTEFRSYWQAEPGETLLRACGQAAAARLGRVFADWHTAHCPALGQLTALPEATEALRRTEDLPLTGELLALWADPTATTRRPVASWLNHFTGLDDVRRVLETRRSGS